MTTKHAAPFFAPGQPLVAVPKSQQLAALNTVPGLHQASMERPQTPTDYLASFQQVLAASNAQPIPAQAPPGMPGQQTAGLSMQQITQLQGLVYQAQLDVTRSSDRLELVTRELADLTQAYEADKGKIAALLSAFNTTEPEKLTTVTILQTAEAKVTERDTTITENATEIERLKAEAVTAATAAEANTARIAELEGENVRLAGLANQETARQAGAGDPPAGDPTPQTAELTTGEAAARAQNAGNPPNLDAQYSAQYADLKNKAEQFGGAHRRAFDLFCDEHLTKIGFVSERPSPASPAGTRNQGALPAAAVTANPSTNQNPANPNPASPNPGSAQPATTASQAVV